MNIIESIILINVMNKVGISMSKQVEDYLNDGMYGTRLPKQAERNHYLGTLRERVVLVLTFGQVMADKGLQDLEKAIKEYPDAKLIFNGHIADRFFRAEKTLANQYNVPYTVIQDEENKTDIGAVLACDYAVNVENIAAEDDPSPEEIDKDKTEPSSFWNKIKGWFQPK